MFALENISSCSVSSIQSLSRKLENDKVEHLIFASYKWDRIDLVKAILATGPKIGYIDEKCGTSAVHRAAKEGQTHVVDWLLRNGTDINLTDKFNRTAVFWSVLTANYEMVEFLADRNADLNRADANGTSPLDRAAQANMFPIDSKYGKTFTSLLYRNAAITRKTIELLEQSQGPFYDALQKRIRTLPSLAFNSSSMHF